ncbi:hypothetical protein IDH44_21020 [Paenibacillus sp. IB182496]|uniref:Putative heavy-metal chelation domain-containing protein n=1 Tax=Paenibacillus sabuli TaxID=2772509 RepID=A0A927GTU9_9BACL|nr:DUF364 domain-containing protein [Paenibacillus sabuli]MBD2847681.1 hypothetical protein [Paenibacillus sabuli]
MSGAVGAGAGLTVDAVCAAVLRGELGPDPGQVPVTGASSIYQTTEFPSSGVKYHNHYVLLRVGGYFGAAAYAAGELDMTEAGQLSGHMLGELLRDSHPAVRAAALDAYLGAIYPHASRCTEAHTIAGGTPLDKALARDALIAETARIRPGQRVALIGVVNPLVEAIVQRGGTCLPCDLQLERTLRGDAVERDMEVVLRQADNVICTGMTLANGSFDRIAEAVRERDVPLTVYAQTGSALAARWIGYGVTGLVAEPFPFTQFSGGPSELYVYATGEEADA